MNDAYRICLVAGGLYPVAAAAFTGHVIGPAIVAVLGAGLACAIVWFVERRTLSGPGRTDRTRV